MVLRQQAAIRQETVRRVFIMKKIYETPEMELLNFEIQDICTLSVKDDGYGNETEW